MTLKAKLGLWLLLCLSFKYNRLWRYARNETDMLQCHGGISRQDIRIKSPQRSARLHMCDCTHEHHFNA